MASSAASSATRRPWPPPSPRPGPPAPQRARSPASRRSRTRCTAAPAFTCCANAFSWPRDGDQAPAPGAASISLREPSSISAPAAAELVFPSRPARTGRVAAELRDASAAPPELPEPVNGDDAGGDHVRRLGEQGRSARPYSISWRSSQDGDVRASRQLAPINDRVAPDASTAGATRRASSRSFCAIALRAIAFVGNSESCLHVGLGRAVEQELSISPWPGCLAGRTARGLLQQTLPV